MEFNGIKINNDKFNEMLNKTMTKALFDPDVLIFLRDHQFKVDYNFLTENLPKFNEFINERDNNDENKVLKGYIPRLIVNGNNDIEISYKPTAELLKKQQAEKAKNNFKLASLPEDLKNASLENFSQYVTTVDNQRITIAQQAVELTKAICDEPNKFHRGWFIYGNFGVGKTYLCGAIANELVKKYQVLLLHVPSFFSKMKGYLGVNNKALMNELDYVKKIDVLMLDDIGANALKPWARDEILGIILEYRMQHKLTTFFTSNYDINFLQEHMINTNQFESGAEAGTKRIIERIKYLSSELRIRGQDLRMQQVENKK